MLTKSLSFEDFKRLGDVLVHDVLLAAKGKGEDQARINILEVLEGEEHDRVPMDQHFFES